MGGETSRDAASVAAASGSTAAVSGSAGGLGDAGELLTRPKRYALELAMPARALGLP
jgi:hypothetical protein